MQLLLSLHLKAAQTRVELGAAGEPHIEEEEKDHDSWQCKAQQGSGAEESAQKQRWECVLGQQWLEPAACDSLMVVRVERRRAREQSRSFLAHGCLVAHLHILGSIH